MEAKDSLAVESIMLTAQHGLWNDTALKNSMKVENTHLYSDDAAVQVRAVYNFSIQKVC